MSQVIDNFSQAEYLVIFLTFIYSFISSQFFTGWGKWIQRIDEEKPGLNHVLFSILVFILLIDFWWISFQRGPGMTQSLAAFFVSLITPLTMSVITFNIFPRGKTEDASLTAYFIRRGRFMFLVLGFDFLANIFVDHYLIHTSILNLETLFRSIGILFCLAGALVPNQKFIRWIAITGFVVVSAHIVLFGEPTSFQAGYSLEEHLTMFITFIYGVIAARFFSGWSHILQHIKTIQFSKEHLIWSILAFGMLIDFWWGSWQREPFITHHLGFFLVSLSLPILFYVLVVVLFPFKEYLDTVRLHDYFEMHKNGILLLFGGIILLNAITANLMEDQWDSIENVYRFVSLLLVGLAYFVPITLVRRLVLAVGSILFIAHTTFQ